MNKQGSAPLFRLFLQQCIMVATANDSGVSVESVRAIVFFDAHLRVMGGIHRGGFECLHMCALVSVLKQGDRRPITKMHSDVYQPGRRYFYTVKQDWSSRYQAFFRSSIIAF